MVRIILPERKEYGKKGLEFVVEPGDLTFLKGQWACINYSHILGIFESYKEQDGRRPAELIFRMPYILHPCEQFGAMTLPLITPDCREKGLVQQYALHRSKTVFVGQEAIADALRAMKGYEPHAEWVEKLKKPYISFNENNNDQRCKSR